MTPDAWVGKPSRSTGATMPNSQLTALVLLGIIRMYQNDAYFLTFQKVFMVALSPEKQANQSFFVKGEESQYDNQQLSLLRWFLIASCASSRSLLVLSNLLARDTHIMYQSSARCE
ncbi:MAG: hypothetical protein ACHBN1_32455 [Heteroscytonema crispum UTEX LB 1556]